MLKSVTLGSCILFISVNVTPMLLMTQPGIQRIDIANNEHTASTNSIVTLTFDDGYQTIFDNAFPILEQYHLHASLFMITGLKELEGSPLMNLSELIQLKNHGWDINSHSVTHQNLNKLNLKEIIYEVTDSKQWIIANNLGDPLAFSYPYGKDNFLSKLIVSKNYRYGRTMEPGLNVINGGKNVALKTYALWGTPTQGSLKLCERKTADDLREGKWIIITIHGVVTDPSYYKVNSHFLWTTTETLTDFVSFLINNSAPVETFTQLPS